MENEVILYGNNKCKFCDEAKTWLLTNEVEFVMKDIEIDANKNEFSKYNVSGIPLLIVRSSVKENEEKIVGFNPGKYEKLFNK